MAKQYYFVIVITDDTRLQPIPSHETKNKLAMGYSILRFTGYLRQIYQLTHLQRQM